MDVDSSTPSSGQSNTRALTIFTIYMATNIFLTLLITSSVIKAYVSRQIARTQTSKLFFAIIAFSILAILSLVVTWHYMLQFFTLSYRSWATTHNIPMPATDGTLQQQLGEMQLGRWLKDVQLFREAWETVVETPPRTCWSLPIFFATTLWAVFIAREAPKRQIKHAWAYMVLGQLVAISFAMNLFYLAVLVHPVPNIPSPGATATQKQDPTTKERGDKPSASKLQTTSTLWTPLREVYSVVLYLTFISISKATSSAGSPYFLVFLALPHVLLLLPPILHVVLPRNLGTIHGTEKAYNTFYKARFEITMFAGALFEAIALHFAFNGELLKDRHFHRHSNVYVYPWNDDVMSGDETAFQNLWRSLFDHPAVSSVGFDAVLCIASLLAWKMTARR